MTFTVPLSGIKFSTNLLYAGVHWSVRKQYKDDLLLVVKHYCKPFVPINVYPVEITYRFLFETTALDTTNTAGMAKCIEDALCAIGLLKDDSPVYVRRTVLEVESVKGKGKYKNDFVKIVIRNI